MKRRYYLIYGLLSKKLSKAVTFIEQNLGIKLDSENTYNDELYVLLEKNENSFPVVDDLTIIDNNGNDYLKENGIIKDVEFLISCNVVSCEDEDKKAKSVEYIRKTFSDNKQFVELNYDFDDLE